MNNKRTTYTLSARELAVIPIFAALTAVLSQISIILPFSPVPISFGLVAVYIAGILLKPKHAVYAQICYLIIGAIGIPVFSNFRGGIAALLGPTGGYLMVYPLMAWIVSMSLNSSRSLRSERNGNKTFVFLRTAAAIFFAQVILYFGGTSWLSMIAGNSFVASLSLAVFPYIPLDIVKILFCIFVIIPIRFSLISLKLLITDDGKKDNM